MKRTSMVGENKQEMKVSFERRHSLLHVTNGSAPILQGLRFACSPAEHPGRIWDPSPSQARDSVCRVANLNVTTPSTAQDQVQSPSTLISLTFAYPSVALERRPDRACPCCTCYCNSFCKLLIHIRKFLHLISYLAPSCSCQPRPYPSCGKGSMGCFDVPSRCSALITRATVECHVSTSTARGVEQVNQHAPVSMSTDLPCCM